LGGFGPVTSGKVRVTYWAGRAPYLGVVDEEVRFTSTISVDAAGGHASVDLVPTGGVCCVRWEITDARNRMLIRHTTIPDAPVVAFGDLVDVDPTTFEPSDAGRAAWEATLAEVQAAVSAAVDARVVAVGAAEAAGASAGAAGMSAAASAVSAGEAAGSASVAAEHEAAASD